MNIDPEAMGLVPVDMSRFGLEARAVRGLLGNGGRRWRRTGVWYVPSIALHSI